MGLELTPDGVKHIPHTCDEQGSYFQLGDGTVISEKSVRCPTSEETYKYVQKIAEERDTWVAGGGVCCSICGAIPNYFL